MLPILKQLRQSRGISQQKLGEAIGASQQAINRYENQDVEPDIATLIRLADYFAVSVDVLIGHERKTAGRTQIVTAQEEEALFRFRLLNDRRKELVLALMDSYRDVRT